MTGLGARYNAFLFALCREPTLLTSVLGRSCYFDDLFHQSLCFDRHYSNSKPLASAKVHSNRQRHWISRFRVICLALGSFGQLWYWLDRHTNFVDCSIRNLQCRSLLHTCGDKPHCRHSWCGRCPQEPDKFVVPIHICYAQHRYNCSWITTCLGTENRASVWAEIGLDYRLLWLAASKLLRWLFFARYGTNQARSFMDIHNDGIDVSGLHEIAY